MSHHCNCTHKHAGLAYNEPASYRWMLTCLQHLLATDVLKLVWSKLRHETIFKGNIGTTASP